MLVTVRQPMAHRDPRILERLGYALAPPVFGALDNQLNTESFLTGRGWMIGDVVEAPRLLGKNRRGEIVRLINRGNTGNPYRTKFFTKAALVSWKAGERYYAPSRLKLIERPRAMRKYFIAIYTNEGVEGSGVWPLWEFSDDDMVKSAFPYWTLESNIDRGLAAIALEGDEAMGRTAFEKTVDQAEKVLKIHTELGRHNPRSKAMVEVFRWLATAFLGDTMESSKLENVIDDLEAYCADIPQGYWDIQGKCIYLETVMIALLAGRVDKARELLRSRRSFRDIEDLRWVLRKLCRKTVRPASDPEFMEKAIGCFDLMRRPFVSYHRDVSGHGIVALLLASLLETFVHSPARALDSQRVARAIFA